MGKFDNTLIIKVKNNDMLIVQIYVDDTIFGSTNSSLYEEFSKCMMGELSFFLGLQIKQGICSRGSNSVKVKLQKLLWEVPLSLTKMKKVTV